MIEFWRAIPYLKNLPSYFVNKLVYHLELVTFDCKDTVVLKEGDVASHVVFVVGGEF